jgi:hypothetical protein
MMYIADYTKWKSVLFVIPIYNDADNRKFMQFREEILAVNPKIVMNAIRWNHDKKIVKIKEYQRVPNEWNHADFNWMGKHRNFGIEDYFKRPYDAMILLCDDMPDKALNIVVNAQATLKIGFDDKLKQFDVVLKSENNSLDGRLDLVRKYFMLR